MLKKGNGTVDSSVAMVFVIAIVIIILIAWLIVVSGRQCSQDSDCPENHYCDADHKCYEHQTVEVNKTNLVIPSIVIGISIIIAAIILRYRRHKETYI